MKKLLAAATAGLALTAAGAHADTTVAAVIGTTGLGLQVSAPFSEKWAVRLGANGMARSYDTTSNQVRYDLDLKIRSVDLLLDFHPMMNPFRVSAGVTYNGNTLTGVARPAGASYVFNGRSYPTASIGRVDADVEFRAGAPYLGIGWGTSARMSGSWSFVSDLGVQFTGQPTARVVSRDCTGPLCPTLAADLAVERAKLQDELDKLKAYPVVRVGVSYTF
ncbi:MAG TPA: hypothetical protein VIT92_00230 [Burkholderiaceae bacterium]